MISNFMLGTYLFEIFGTSATDVLSIPYVLSPPLIDSLRHFVPDRLFHNNLWMKYSLIRDGASLSILLRNIRGSQHTLLAIEIMEEDVFRCFASLRSCKYRSLDI